MILDNIGTDPWTIRRNSQRLPSYRCIENPIQKFVVLDTEKVVWKDQEMVARLDNVMVIS
jgi:hypothetical protein